MMRKNEELDSITREVMKVDAAYKEVAKKKDKLLPRERINAILDKGTPFLEIG
jgi:acetyl-CoA carboxylase carboxyltransferase component